jgi:general secretion pathway protein L
MSEMLVLWPRPPGWWWLVTDENGSPFASGQVVQLPQVSADRVILLLPTEEITLTAVELPNLTPARLRQALPYALEEWVAGDVEQLHIAHGPRLADGRIPVAAIQSQQLQDYLKDLADQNIVVDIAMPDALCLPWREGHISLAPCAGGWLYRHGIHDAGFVEPENLETFLELLEAEAKTTHVYGETTPSIHMGHTVQHRDQSTLAALLPAAAEPAWQLLQNVSGSASQKKWQGMGKWLGGMTAAVLIALFAHAGLDWWLLKQQAQDEQQRIQTVFQRLFPGQPISDARVQTERLLARRSQTGDQFLRQLNTAAPILAASDTLKLEGMDYDGENLVLRLKAPVVADLDEFSQTLSQQSMSARVLSATLGADGVDGVVRISEAGGGNS